MGVDQRGVDLAAVNTQDVPKFGSTQTVNHCGADNFHGEHRPRA